MIYNVFGETLNLALSEHWHTHAITSQSYLFWKDSNNLVLMLSKWPAIKHNYLLIIYDIIMQNLLKYM